MKLKRKNFLFYFSLISLFMGSLFYFTSPTTSNERTQVGVLLLSSENKWPQDQLKAGLEQAAKELNVELIYKEVPISDFENQRESISEQLDGTSGVITYGLYDPKILFKSAINLINLEQNEIQTDNSGEMSDTADYHRGATLGQSLAANIAAGNKIIYWQSPNVVDSEGRKNGLQDHLGPNQTLTVFTGEIQELIQLLQNEMAATSLVIDNPQQMLAYSDAVTQVKLPLVKSIYLLEFSNQVLAAIDHQEVTGAILQDNYSRGYQSLYQLLGDKNNKNRQLPENQIVTKENLFSPDLEPLVFPYKE